MDQNSSNISSSDASSSENAVKKEPSASPISSQQRKRKNASVEENLELGLLKENVLNDSFNVVLDGDKREKLRCLKCQKLISCGPGSHQTLHKTGKCCVAPVFTKRALNSTEGKTLNKALVNYLLKSGCSFNHLESDNFRSMIFDVVSVVAPDLDQNSISLPSAEWMRSEAEVQSDENIQKISDEISQAIKDEEACIVLDFGRKWHDFLSVFLVFVDKTKNPRLRVVPFAFSPVFSSKTTENIVTLLEESGRKFNVSKEDLVKLRITGDGAANIKKLKETFKSYTYCACHSVQKCAERILDPLDVSKRSEYQPDELKHLLHLKTIVELCGSISHRVRRLKVKDELPRLPTVYCSTRWLTFLYCARDVLELFKDLKSIRDNSLRSMLFQLEPEIPNMMSFVSLLEYFEQPLKRFEESDVKIHEVAPVLYSLKNVYEEEVKVATEKKDFTRRVVAKSAVVSLKLYIDKTISETHLMATFLCPGLKSLESIPQDKSSEALIAIRSELLNVQVPTKPQKIPAAPVNKKDIFRAIYDAPTTIPSDDFELDDYQKLPVSAEEISLCPLAFWARHSQRFPRLSKVANGIFCVLASESVCERSFSHLNKVFRADRLNLDPYMVEKLMISYLYLNDFF